LAVLAHNQQAAEVEVMGNQTIHLGLLPVEVVLVVPV
jgi:hypothetical protein